MLVLKVKKIHDNAVIPKKVTGNLGFDLHVVRDEKFYEYSYPGPPNTYKYNLKPQERRLFHTGLKIELPPDKGVLLRDRSGMAAKYGIHVLAGVIDQSYLGEYLICLLNTSNDSYIITEGDRIAQGILVREYDYWFMETNTLGETFRGEAGFGSTGK